MTHARALVAMVLAVGLVIIAVIQELGDVELAEDMPGVDATMLLLAVAIIILIVPDAISYWRSKRHDKE